MCWGGSPPPAGPTPAPAATEADTSVIEARRRVRAAAGFSGQGQTVLTSSAGAPLADAILGRKTLLGQ